MSRGFETETVPEITPEMIEAAAMELWDWLGDGKTQNEGLSLIRREADRIIAAAFRQRGKASRECRSKTP